LSSGSPVKLAKPKRSVFSIPFRLMKMFYGLCHGEIAQGIALPRDLLTDFGWFCTLLGDRMKVVV
jgi:hypothetical protein